jgi:hypothetical protein
MSWWHCLYMEVLKFPLTFCVHNTSIGRSTLHLKSLHVFLVTDYNTHVLSRQNNTYVYVEEYTLNKPQHITSYCIICFISFQSNVRQLPLFSLHKILTRRTCLNVVCRAFELLWLCPECLKYSKITTNIILWYVNT